MAVHQNKLDKYFSECLKQEKKLFLEKFKSYKKANIKDEVLIEENRRELQSLTEAIFDPVDYDGYIHPADPFMAKLMGYFDQLLEHKQENIFTKLFEKRSIFEVEAKRIRFYGDDELINLPNEKIIDFLAMFRMKSIVNQIFEGEKTFLKWQGNNQEVIKNILKIERYSDYRQVEFDLYHNGYLTPFGKWSGNKTELVAFILKLEETKYLKTRNLGKPIPFKTYRDIFNQRYQIDISKECEPLRRKAIASQKHHFIWSLLKDSSINL